MNRRDFFLKTAILTASIATGYGAAQVLADYKPEGISPGVGRSVNDAVNDAAVGRDGQDHGLRPDDRYDPNPGWSPGKPRGKGKNNKGRGKSKGRGKGKGRK